MTPESVPEIYPAESNWAAMTPAEREAFLNKIVSISDSDPSLWGNKTPKELSELPFNELPGALKGQLALCVQGDGFDDSPDIEVVS